MIVANDFTVGLAERGGHLIQVAPRVWHIPIVPPHAINAYLIDDVLIDAGTRHRGRQLLAALEGRPLSLLALTQCRGDHQGAARLICEQRGIQLACHEADAAAMEGRAPMQPQNLVFQTLARLLAGPPRRVDRLLRNGDTVADFRVVHTPGHTPGHVIYFRERDGVAIAGDLLGSADPFTGRPGLREPPRLFSVDPEQNRRSIRLLSDLRPSLICFGHGPPLRDAGELGRFVGRLEGRGRSEL